MADVTPSTKKIAINAVSSSLQVVVVSIIYFLLYRYLLVRIGVSQLGVWSLVLATASLVNMANLGITTSMVKFVAQYRAEEKNTSIDKLVFTAFISMIVFFAVLIAVLYLAASFILKKIVDADHLQIALQILPFSLCSLFINGLGGVFTSLLDGLQKNYVRNLIYVCSSILLLVLSYILVPIYKINGVAYAQVIQAGFVLVVTFILSARYFNARVFFKWSWDKPIFKDIFAYGLKFQVISISQLLYEPTTKMLLSKFGGLSSVAYYEMGSRLVNQVRGLIVNANQVIVPVVANAAVKNKEAIAKIYANSMSIILFITVPLISGLIIFASSISLLWIGHIENAFVFTVIILSIGMFFNIMGTPAYYGYMGEGNLNAILVMHVSLAVINLVGGYLLSKAFPLYGAMLGWGIALVTGSFAILLIYQKSKTITFKSFFSTKDYILTISCLAVTIFAIAYSFMYTKSTPPAAMFIGVQALIFCVLYIPLLLINKNAKLLLSIAGNMFKK